MNEHIDLLGTGHGPGLLEKAMKNGRVGTNGLWVRRKGIVG